MANQIKLNTTTGKTFLASGGDATFTLTSLGTGAGRLSARLDLGAYPRPGIWRWYGQTKSSTTTGMAVGLGLEFYAVFWNDEATPGEAGGTHGSTDAAMTTEAYLRNTVPIGQVEADEVSSTRSFQRIGTLFIPTRYISIIAWNRLGAALSATAGDHKFAITPLIDEIQ